MGQVGVQMTSWRRTAAAVVLVGAMLVGVSGAIAPNPVHAAGEQVMLKDTISVSGIGEIEVTPDVAYVDIAVETRANTAAEAQQKNAAAFDKVKQVLTQKYGVQDKDLKTTNFSVDPVYKYAENTEPKVVAYQAQHAVRVTYRDLARLGSLVDAATSAGANRIMQINYDTEKRSDYETQVLEKAVQHATKKAQALAKAANREAGMAITIVESGADWTPVRIMSEQMKVADSASNSVSSPQGGLVKLRAQVQVQFQMK
ncbi:SIMPL domain-containing protein [Paenibacillus sp. OSY-SE]|uniref:SIMPL domain-containing protein n=1 Tax=Paenibacillus sp. OSY-SE TaxID=1196323 RepID=UPI0002EDA725|nr:SIMPL domain-containing protein [Paenibacillus sp. OSY-SE]